MSLRPRLLGAVLAGGEGRRFGGPKADVSVGGRTLVGRAVEALAPVVEEVVIVSSRPIGEAIVAILPDATPGIGPLGGLQAALHAAAERGLDGVFALACDLPLVEAPLLERVRDALGDHAAVAPGRPSGGIEPLCAVYRVDVLGALAKRITSDDRSVHALFREVGGVELTPSDLGSPEGSAFLNVNTPDDRDRAERALTARRHVR